MKEATLYAILFVLYQNVHHFLTTARNLDYLSQHRSLYFFYPHFLRFLHGDKTIDFELVAAIDVDELLCIPRFVPFCGSNLANELVCQFDA